ncbi:MAG: alkaline phosphatase family protein [Lewinellaceae bacterium]|nr:alkaline phosphatase family protein [Phaeodactylibacter sp.]MCB9346681.1 alkaline phosphatase family protein [Lewinellaceae bacterium]
MKQIYLLFFLVFSLALQGQQNKVLIIGIDGCRPDALMAAEAPHLQGLLQNAVYSLDALTHAPTWSATGWSSMLTGVWEDKHGALENSFANTNYVDHPHFFDRLEAFNPEWETYSVCHWGPINDQIVNACDGKFNVSTDAAVRDKVVQLLINENPTALFMHFDDVDHAGHQYGFSPAIPEYLQRIEATDEYVGDLLEALQLRPNFEQENWLILASTDHGGTPGGHGGASLEERNIFVIAHHPALPSLPVSKVVSTFEPATGLAFDGQSQYLLPADSTPFQFGDTVDFSIELRVKYEQLDGDAAFISNKDWDSGSNPGFVLSTPFSDQSRWKVNIGDGSQRADLTGGRINDGAWHQLSATFDRDGAMALYQDGEYLGSTDISYIGNIDAGLPLVIGQDGAQAYPAWFNGFLGEVRIWRKVLSPETIRRYACSPVESGHPDYESLLAYWPADEGSGSIILDRSPAEISCNLVGAPPSWIENPGQMQCLNYDDTPRITDIAVTALQHLCVPIDPAWGLDGNVLADLCMLTATEEPDAATWMRLSPNPFQNVLSIDFPPKTEEAEKQIVVFDALGRKLKSLNTHAARVELDTRNWLAGCYWVQARQEGKHASQMVIKQ